MMFYPMDYVIERTLEKRLSREQWLLREFTGRRFEQKQAKTLWDRIADHKWYVSERLGRDIGMKVAAIDFVENVYEPPRRRGKPGMNFRIPFRSAEHMTFTT